MSITHAFTSEVADGGDASLVRPSNWNAAHVVSDQNANLVFAGPASGAAAAPTFRTQVAADVPFMDANIILAMQVFG